MNLSVEMISSCRKPIISADSCFFQDDMLEFNTDLFAMMRIWDHDKDAILHHMEMLSAWIRPRESKARQSLDQSCREIGASLADNCYRLL